MAIENGWVTLSNGAEKQFKASSPKQARKTADKILNTHQLKQNDIQREREGELRITLIIFGKKKRVIYDEKVEETKRKHRGNRDKRLANSGCCRRHQPREPQYFAVA